MAAPSLHTESVSIASGVSGFLAKPRGVPGIGVVVLMEAFGLNAFVKGVCERFARAGYLALAPDIYHGDLFAYTDRERAIARVNDVDDDMAMREVGAALDTLASQGARDGRHAIVGFCMGGRIAFLMAAASKSFQAAVDFYGGGVYSQWGDRPAPSELAANVACPVQGHFGELDKNPPPDEMRRLDAALTELGKEHQFFFYSNAPHGFNRAGWDGYRPEADTASWARTLEFFSKHLGNASARKAAVG